MVSVLQSGKAWTDVFAFNAFIEASNGLPVTASTVEPYNAGEIATALIVLAGIDGALAMPIKTKITGYIKASLDNEGWTNPPLFMMFKSMEELYEGNEDYIASLNKKFGNLTIDDITEIDDFKKLGITRRFDLQNYIAMNQYDAEYIRKTYEKMLFDWTVAINGA
jgi:hypothetical protein